MNETYLLADGFFIPKIGFGTFKLRGQNGARRVEAALANGYRLLDTAFKYDNEGAVGAAIKNSSVPRDQITVTSKLPGCYQRYADAMITVQESIARLGLDYIDVYLIHWPNPAKNLFVEAWQALIDAQKAGLIRSIGVCNFLPEHLERLEKETGVLPVINQIELHPRFNQAAQRAYDRSKNIVTEAWSPLGRGTDLLSNPVLAEIANQHQKSIAQIVLRWHLQLGNLPIPKSENSLRQIENISVFDFSLSEEELQLINAMSMPNGRINNQDPAVYQEL